MRAAVMRSKVGDPGTHCASCQDSGFSTACVSPCGLYLIPCAGCQQRHPMSGAVFWAPLCFGLLVAAGFASFMPL